MTQGLTGVRIAFAECRQMEELAAMLIKEGAVPIRCPMLAILNTPDTPSVEAWIRELIADQFAWVIFFTGEGIRRLTGFADRMGQREAFIAALNRTKIITRGPKPVRALKELELSPTKMAEKPTTEGVIASLREIPLGGMTIGVQRYVEENIILSEFLASVGALEKPILPYVYAAEADASQVIDVIQGMLNHSIQAIVFTSSPQADRIFEVAREHHLESELLAGLAQVPVAAVGPIAAESLRAYGVTVSILPEQGFVMKNLVQHIKRHFAAKPSDPV